MSDYPVYVSPDGQHEQVAATPIRQVQLKHAGWRPKKSSTAHEPDERPAAPRAPKQAKPVTAEPQQ